MKVMFLDDLTYRMKYFVQELRNSGIDVRLRSDLDQAFEDFKAGVPWDGVIMDVMFTNPEPPRRYVAEDPTGFDVGPLLIRDLRAIQPGLRIVAISSIPGRPSAQALGGITGVCLLSKLVNVFEFRDTVMRFFSSGRPIKPGIGGA